MKNFIIISGSSGSGKTTLLELLSRDLNIEISVSYTQLEIKESMKLMVSTIIL